MGVSPRGTLALMRCCKALACMEGRDYVTPDDVKSWLLRYWPTGWCFPSEGAGRRKRVKLMEEILKSVPVPVEDFSRR